MITFGGPQCIVDKSIKKIIAEVRPLFCWRCQHFGNKRSSNPSLRVLRIRKGKFLVKNCSLAHIASVHNCLLCCQHLFEFLGFPRLGSLGFPPSVWSSWAPWALGSGLWAPWTLGSGQDVLGSRVYWAPEITGLPGLPNRNLLSVFEVFSPLRQFFKFRIWTKNVSRDCLHNASLKCW